MRVDGDRLVVAVCDSPETGSNQRIMVLDMLDVVDGKYTVTDEIEVDPKLCLTPHEMAVSVNGDIFLACVTYDNPKTGASTSHVQLYNKF